MKCGIIIQAQLELDLNLKNEDLFYNINDKNVLEITVDQALKCDVDKVIVLYSAGNEKYINFNKLKEKNIIFYKNDGKGFLKQFKKIAKNEDLGVVVRVIGNNLLIIPDLINKSLKLHLENGYDYTYFKGYPIGVRPSEIISYSLLESNICSDVSREYARYISTVLLNRDDLNSNCFEVLNEYKGYDKVNFSFSKNKSDKFKKIIQEDINFKTIKKFFNKTPNTIKHIEITNLCNIDCIMCSRSGELSKRRVCKKGFMSLENFKTILGRFEYIDELTLLGGEPLLHPNIIDIISYCVSEDIKVNLVTNGLLLNDELSSFLVDNLSAIRFSIDGPNKEIFEAIRKKADFDVLVKNIKRFMQIYRSNKNFKLKRVGINYVYMKQNYQYMPKMIELANELTIKEVSFNPYCNPSFITDKKVIDEFNIKNMKKLDTIFSLVREKSNEFDISVKTDAYNASWIHEWNQCEYIESFYITWDGFITPCCAIDRKELFNFGSILNNSIETLYNSNKWRKFRDGLINNIPHDVCKKNCYYYYGNLKKENS